MPQVLLRIYFMDNSHKTVYVDPIDTTIEQLWSTVAEKMLLDHDSAECFFLWQISKDLEILLYSDMTIQDAYDDWPKMVEQYGARRTLTDDLKTVAAQVVNRPELTRSPTKINLQTSKSTSKASTMRTSTSFGKAAKPAGLARSSSRVGNLEDGDVEDFKLVFRPTSVLPLSVEHSLTQPEAIHLLFVQAIILAGVQLQIQLGDQKPDHLEHIKEAWDNYIPEHLREKRKPEEWVQDVYSAHQLHKGKDVLALKRAYLEVVQQWPFYGCTFFRVNFFKQEYQGTVVVGINHYGIHMIHPRALKFETWKFQDLVYWDSNNATFGFEVVTGVKQEPTRTYTLKTPQADLINDLMHDWSEEWQAQVKGDKDSKRKSMNRRSAKLSK